MGRLHFFIILEGEVGKKNFCVVANDGKTKFSLLFFVFIKIPFLAAFHTDFSSHSF